MSIEFCSADRYIFLTTETVLLSMQLKCSVRSLFLKIGGSIMTLLDVCVEGKEIKFYRRELYFTV